MVYVRALSAARNTMLFGLLSSCIVGCAVVDNVGPRTEVMNLTMADYNAYATLLNIVRASQHEPLNFVAVTQGSPNTSFTGNAAAPSYTFAPWHLTQQVVGGNTATGAVSNALTVQPLDDPASWQAMLTPVDVATIGFFIKQGYPRELLFWLFVDKLRRKIGPNQYQEFNNDPVDKERVLLFLGNMAKLILEGLTVEIERGAPKSGQYPTSRICFSKAESELAAAIATKNLPTLGGGPNVPARPPFPLERDICGGWLPGQAQAGADSQGAGSKACCSSTPSPAKKAPNPLVWYDVPGGTWEFSTRSAYAVYQIMGRWLEKDLRMDLITVEDDQHLIDITKDQPGICFANLFYKGRQYCVPEYAYNTKRTFAILHQVAGLNIAHAQTPGTLTVRSVP